MNIMAEHFDFNDNMGKAWNSVNGRYRLQSVWLKLKAVKIELKMMRTQKFGKVHEKVEYLRQKLTDLQNHVDFNSNEETQNNEKGLSDDLRHWSNIEENIL